MKPYFIIGDSSTDLTSEQESKLNIDFAPLVITIDGKDYIDDKTLVLDDMIAHMKASKNSPKTACPSPDQYFEAAKKADSNNIFFITLSSALSGSYQSACIAKDMIEEELGKKVYVIDSRSAASGQGNIALSIGELFESGLNPEQVYEEIQKIVTKMKTIFVLERLDNLRKNGRLNLIASAILSILSIKLVLVANEAGEIKMEARAQGVKKALSTMVDIIAKDLNGQKGHRIVVAHCLNEGRGQDVIKEIKEKCDFEHIELVPMHGLSGNYSDEGGIVIGFY